MSTTDTERDERLRRARDFAGRLRESLPRLPGGPTEYERALLALDDQVARLDAVVTAVREVHAPQPLLAGQRVVICQCCLSPHPCATVRALDGGAA